jgi:hypothetical protein
LARAFCIVDFRTSTFARSDAFQSYGKFHVCFTERFICCVRGFAFISLFDGVGLSLLLLQGDVVSVISGEH